MLASNRSLTRSPAAPPGGSRVRPEASGAVALLELLPRAAPAGVVAADVLVLVDSLLLHRESTRRNRHLGERSGSRAAGGGDRIGACSRLVGVLEIAVVSLHGLEISL